MTEKQFANLTVKLWRAIQRVKALRKTARKEHGCYIFAQRRIHDRYFHARLNVERLLDKMTDAALA